MENLMTRVGMGSVVAVIPAYNEERFIGSVVLSARNYCDVVIVVDDGSLDRTAALASAAGAVVVRRPTQGGKGEALNSGFNEAITYNPCATVILDGDAQHDPAEISIVAKPVLDGLADVVIGSRFLSRDRRAIPWWRQIGQKVLTVATNHASGVVVTDSQTGYRAFSQEALYHLRFRSKGLSVESEMQFLLKNSHLRIAEVPIHVQYLDGNKRNPFKHGLSIVDTMIGLVARRRPLLFFSVPGFCLVIFGLLLGYHSFRILQVDHVIPPWSTVMGTMLLIVGLLFGVTGTILNTLEHFAIRVTEELTDLSHRSPERQPKEENPYLEPIGRHIGHS